MHTVIGLDLKFASDNSSCIRDTSLLGAERILIAIGRRHSEICEAVSETTEYKSNRKNGKVSKTIKSSDGEIELVTGRDRNGTFEPEVVKKPQLS